MPLAKWTTLPTGAIGSAIYIFARANPTTRKIRSFGDLPVGWDYGAGGPIDRTAQDAALEWDNFFRTIGIIETDAFPDAGGEVIVSGARGDHYFEVIIEPDKRVSLAYDLQGKQSLYCPNISAEEARETISRLVGHQWKSFGFFILANTIESRRSGPEQLLETLQPTDIYQLLRSTVSETHQPFAHISGHTIDIQAFSPTLPSSGVSPWTYFPTDTR
jgi:hypothetical protein